MIGLARASIIRGRIRLIVFYREGEWGGGRGGLRFYGGIVLWGDGTGGEGSIILSIIFKGYSLWESCATFSEF